MRPYVIKQGDYLTKLAHDHGFDSATVWQHPDNKELRERRGHQEILAPGDVLRLPQASRHRLSIESGSVNQYQGPVPRVPIDVVLMIGNKPLANEACTIVGAGPRGIERQTDAKGHLSFDVPLHVREVRVLIQRYRLALPMLVGHMDPILEPSGVRARLANLGYCGLAGGEVEQGWDDPGLTASLRSFQRAHGLKVTGLVDDATRDALLRIHGT